MGQRASVVGQESDVMKYNYHDSFYHVDNTVLSVLEY